MRQVLLLNVFFLFSITCFSQTTIDGALKTKEGNSVSGASVTITKLQTDDILDYGISSKDGSFSISIESQSNQVRLNIRAMGYKTLVQIIANKTQTLDFVLEEEATQLKEVIVKSDPITRRGDTLNYAVSAFAKKEDRTLADALKNMPGIEVLSDGKILYQGKPINKFYIENLDLLEGKYNLANSNLPHKEVSRVQVLENHQPTKILDSLVYSDKAAINIKLKNSYTFTGQAEVGSGLSPLLWDVNLTPMLFTKKQQMLTSYQANNTGNDVSQQLKTLTIEDLMNQFENNSEKQDWLATQQLSAPRFSEKRWLDNNIHLLSANYLQKLKKDYELRLNVSYLNDYQQQEGSTNTQFFTANDTIALAENKYNQLYTNTLEADLTLHRNTKKNFLKNSLQFQGSWDSQRGSIQTDNTPLTQNLSNRYFKLSNKLKTIFPIGEQLMTLNSYVGFNKTPQSLTVNPGQFEDLLNDGEVYDEVTQDIDLNTFYTNNALGFTKGWQSFSFNPKVGLQFEKQKLESRIFTNASSIQDNIDNNLDWTRSKAYFKLKTQYKKNNWRLEAITPVHLHSYQLNDKPLQKEQDFNRLTFEPRLSINYDLSSYWRVRAATNLSNQFGTINQVYYNYILKNYRNIQRIDAPLPEMQSLNYSASFRYRNPIKSLFFTLSYTNTTTENNLLYSNQILENGASELRAIEEDNKRHSHNLSTRASKYFRNFDTNITLNVNYSLQDFQQVLNSEITDISNQNWRLKGKVDTDITDWLSVNFESIFQFSKNKIQSQNNQNITQQFHKFNINIYPKENQYLGLKTEYIKNNLFSKNSDNFFADLIYRYTWQKKNIDFELQWNNIFDIKNYKTVNINNYSYIETNYNLRPSQILFKVRFSL
ncbi:MAG: carboxypeptidase-like regulatory domain-containing protein [Psychroflexus sp.]|nr:carboxypeptidase-like regulatory domain-containing protein [Psychroflexus sp.]